MTKMEAVQGKVETQCELCSGGQAIAFCRQCTEFICAECVRSHQKMKTFAGHVVTTLDELREPGRVKEIPMKSPPPPTCSIHDQEQMRLYCFDCDHLICRDCIILDHKEHKYDFVKKVAPEAKEKLAEHLAPLKTILTSIYDATEIVKSTKTDVESQSASVAITVDQLFGELHDIIEQRKQEILKELSSITEFKLNQLSVQKKEFAMSSSVIQSLVDSWSEISRMLLMRSF